MRFTWQLLFVLALVGLAINCFGYQPLEVARLQSEHLQRMEFNRKRLDEMQGKLQMLGRILATKEGKMATVNNAKFDLEIEMGDLELKLKILQTEVSAKQNKISRLIKALVVRLASKDDSMTNLIVVKSLKENIVKLESQLKDSEQQMIHLKSKIWVVTQNLRNFGEQESILAEQLLELKESRAETLEVMSEIEKKIDELLKVKLVDDSVLVKAKERNFTVIIPLESYGQSRITKKGMTLHFRDKVAILAPANGRVAYLGQLGNLGDVVIIDHGQEYRSILLGKASYIIGIGDTLTKGDVIGHAKVDSLNDIATGQIYFEIRHKNIPKLVTSFIDSQYNVSLNSSKKIH
ncbi:MAG: peptidoglycan DD-metalloendopeptidase family protein [Bdellovibrio sp.]|nr:peptidoglycan DD-metalloendopeptidase family protein [Bdellovibrio sp.]